MKKTLPLLLRAVAGAVLLTAPTPTIAASITPPEFIAQVQADIAAGDLGAARHLLRQLHARGVKWLEIGGKRIELETLINALPNRVGFVIERLSLPGTSKFLFCDPELWTTKPINLTAPGEVFPVSSSGCF